MTKPAAQTASRNPNKKPIEYGKIIPLLTYAGPDRYQKAARSRKILKVVLLILALLVGLAGLVFLL